ncbi:hypothetical protein [Exiguobacterium aurantiacum]|uniref:hypothetical protein n=1 Tax=Exiguobacterium aurantiacum TaxID=33987 RepID=UPI00087783EE|nr:hypothetical protein [Exiguobacterium aurantiacum]
MKSYVEETIHVDLAEAKIKLELPLSLKNIYEFRQWTIEEQHILLALPQTNVSVVTLEKHLRKLSKTTGTPVVFGFNTLSTYKVNQMTAKGIPFILNEQQIYMPFIGTFLSKAHLRDLPEVTKVSVQTQRLLLLSIYKNWAKLSLIETAQRLGVSRMTASRIFDELEAIDSSLVHRKGKERIFSRKVGLQTFWDTIFPYLFNPVIREYRLDKEIQADTFMKSGLSAFSEYTMLNETDYPIYGMTREDEKEYQLKEQKTIRSDDTPVCVVQIVKYKIKLDTAHLMDPLSVVLSLTDDEKADPRIDIEIERLKERVLRG